MRSLTGPPHMLGQLNPRPRLPQRLRASGRMAALRIRRGQDHRRYAVPGEQRHLRAVRQGPRVGGGQADLLRSGGPGEAVL